MLNNEINSTSDVQLVNYVYNGNSVKFRINGKLMINATQMAKPFGSSKRPLFWLKTQAAKDFINYLSKVRNLTLTDLVQVKYGGKNPGTWMHEDVALEFARWLSPAFAIWCNDRIKDILISRVSGKGLNERELSSYIYNKLSESKSELSKYVESKRKEYLISSTVHDLSMGCYWDENRDLKANIDNLLAIFNNNTAAGYSLLMKALRYERDRNTLLNELQQLSNTLYEKYKIIPE